MSTKRSSIAFVVLLLASLLPLSSPEAETDEVAELASEHDLFNGFLVGAADDVWNETPGQTWPYLTVFPTGV